MQTIKEFASYTPRGIPQYSAYNSSPTSMGGMQIQFLGVKESITHFTAIAHANNLEDFINNKLDELVEKLWDDAPVDTEKYRESIRVDNQGKYGATISIGQGVDNKKGYNYAKFLIYGAKTLHAAAAEGRWPTAYTRGSLGILHDVQGTLYDWENRFWDDMDKVQFTQPRDAGGHFTQVF